MRRTETTRTPWRNRRVRGLVFAVAAVVVLAGCDDDADRAAVPGETPVDDSSAEAGEAAGGSAGSAAAPDPAEGDDPVSAADGATDEAGDEDSADPASGGGSGGGDDGDGDGDGDTLGCVGAWMTDAGALEATLEGVMAEQGVDVEYEVLGNGFMEIREDGAVIVEYDGLEMFGDIGAGSIELTFTWAATGFIVDGELSLEGFEEPTVDAAMFIAGEPFDMGDMIADMELTTGFASVAPVAVECDGEAVTLTPADPQWALRWVPLA